MDARVGEHFSDVVVEIVILAVEVISQSDLEGVLYREFGGSVGTLLFGHVVEWHQQRTRVLKIESVDEGVQSRRKLKGTHVEHYIVELHLNLVDLVGLEFSVVANQVGQLGRSRVGFDQRIARCLHLEEALKRALELATEEEQATQMYSQGSDSQEDHSREYLSAESHLLRVLPPLPIGAGDQQALGVHLKVFANHLDRVLDL